MEKFETIEKKLDTQLAKYPMALQAERRLGHPKTRLLLFSLSLVIGLILLYLNPDFAQMLIATVMPTICTVRLLKAYSDSMLGSVGAGPKLKECKFEMWMAYWLIFSKLLIIETLGINRLLPLYSFLRIIFVVWLQAPGLEGAQVIYDKVIKHTIHFVYKGSSSTTRPTSALKSTLREKKAEAEEKIDEMTSTSPTGNVKSFQTEPKQSPSPMRSSPSSRKED